LSSDIERVDEVIVLVHADVDFHPVGEALGTAVIPLVPLLVLVPLAQLGFARIKVELGT
jgi:hypothetical protein